MTNPQDTSAHNALIFGLGYTGRAIAARLLGHGWHISATGRTVPVMDGVTGHTLDSLPDATLANASLIISTVPPNADGSDPVLDALTLPHVTTLYLSATSVYGDRQGQWAFAAEPPTPVSARGHRRAEAELRWLETGAPVHILRLAGIYGPGINGQSRNAFDKMTRAVIKPGHTVNRIHVADIADLVMAIASRPSPGIYNVADGHPGPPEDVIRTAARIAGAPAPRELDWRSPELSPMARSFYAETKRVDISQTCRTFGWRPAHTDIETALLQLWAER